MLERGDKAPHGDRPTLVERRAGGWMPRRDYQQQAHRHCRPGTHLSPLACRVSALAEGLHIRMPVPRAPSLLTPREAEILGLIAEGMSNKVIARRLGISAHTVKYHLEAVFAKLAVNSRAEALSKGVRQGLVSL